MPHFSASLFTLLPFVRLAFAACECGYLDSATGLLWRESFTSDFVTDTAAALSANWQAQDWSDPANSKGIVMENTPNNVYEWTGGPALALEVSAWDGDTSSPVLCAEIDSQRDDILYGSFRALMTVPSTPGVCTGFFTYHDDTQETDIEFLSWESNYYQSVHYTVQPSPTDAVVLPNVDFTAYGTHRFDWLPGEVNFYYNSDKTANIQSSNVASVGSTLILNVWSNGESWSEGPPTQDAVAHVQSINAYFNSTSLSASQFEANCKAANVAVCEI